MKADPEFAEILEGLEGDTVGELFKSLYGLVQASRVWYKKFAKILTEKLGFIRSKSDPCLFYRKDEHGEIILCVYVDDCAMFGEETALEDVEKNLGKYLTVKVTEMDEYVGCSFLKTEKGLKLYQPRLIKRMREKFWEKINHLKSYKVPLPAGYVSSKPKEDDVVLSREEQQEYQSGTGMCLYLVKHSRPEIGNATRELSKQMQVANYGHLKNLHRLLKFVIDTAEAKLKLEPIPLSDTDNVWKLKGVVDCGFAGDPDTRRSVTGFLIYFCGVLVSWKSKMQKNVTLSSTEGEYVGISEISMEILFLWDVLKFMGITVELPIVVHVDNAGAIFLAKNNNIGQRTKHIQTRYHFVREYIEDGILKVVYICGEDNDADVMTKNTGGLVFWKHTGKFMDYSEVPVAKNREDVDE